jgi:hypothetical protein
MPDILAIESLQVPAMKKPGYSIEAANANATNSSMVEDEMRTRNRSIMRGRRRRGWPSVWRLATAMVANGVTFE